MTTRSLSIVLLTVLAWLPARLTHAQAAPNADVAISYSFLRFQEGNGYNVPAGWLVSVSRRVAPVLSIVGEVSGNYKSEEGDWLMVHSFMGGVRVAPGSRGAVRPFGQFLAGAVTGTCCGGETDTKFAIEPGGGIDVPIGGRTAARIAASLPMVFADGDTTNLFRFQAGLVFSLGAK